MPSCVFKHCKSCSQKPDKNDGLSFHRFPTDFELRDEWILIVRQSREDEDWLPSKFCVVCSLHFAEDDVYFTEKGRRLIKKTAKPTKNLVDTAERPSFEEQTSAAQEVTFGRMPNIKQEQCSPHGLPSVKMEESGPSQSITSGKLEEPGLSVNVHGIKQEQLDPLEGINVKVEPELDLDVYGRAEGTETVKLFGTQSKTVPSNSMQTDDPPGANSDEDDIGESDLDSIYDTSMESRLKKRLKRREALCLRYRSKLKSATQKIRRLEERKTALKTIVAKRIQRDATSACENPTAVELFRHLYHRETRRTPYSDTFKHFCSTLYGYSPKAYEFVRETFDNCLPHPHTLNAIGPILSDPKLSGMYDYVE